MTEVKLTPAEKALIKDNLPTYKAWVGVNENLQPGHDLIAPLIKAWERETKSTFTICKECTNEVLRWAIAEYLKPEDKKAKKEGENG